MKSTMIKISAAVGLLSVSVAVFAANHSCCGDLADCCMELLACCF